MTGFFLAFKTGSDHPTKCSGFSWLRSRSWYTVKALLSNVHRQLGQRLVISIVRNYLVVEVTCGFTYDLHESLFEELGAHRIDEER